LSERSIALVAVLIAVVSLAVAGYSLNLVLTLTAPKPMREFLYEVKFTRFAVDNVSKTGNLTVDTFVITGVVYPFGQVDKAPSLGSYISYGTGSANITDNIAVSILTITGVGQQIMDGKTLEPGAPNVTETGAVTGGTGQFTGVQGSYSEWFMAGTDPVTVGQASGWSQASEPLTDCGGQTCGYDVVNQVGTLSNFGIGMGIAEDID